MMPEILKTYTSQDAVPEALRGYYIEQDGKWLPNVEGVKTQEDVDRAMAAMDKQKTLRIEAEKTLAKYKDVDLEKWERLKDVDPENLGDLDPADEKAIQKRISEAVREKEREMQATIREREDALTAEKEAVENRFRENHLSQWRRNVLAERFGFTDLDALDTFLLKIDHSEMSDFKEARRALKTIEVQDEDGRFRVVGGELKDEKGALEVLERVAKQEVAKSYRPAPDTSGSGSRNSKGSASTDGNPYAQKTLNVTEQGRLESENPQEAKRLAAAAGLELDI